MKSKGKGGLLAPNYGHMPGEILKYLSIYLWVRSNREHPEWLRRPWRIRSKANWHQKS